jgi:hypothetical protein
LIHGETSEQRKLLSINWAIISLYRSYIDRQEL